MEQLQVKTETMNLADIEPNTWNPNEMVGSDFQYLKDSKKWFGNLQDILIWRQDSGKSTIIDGEHRWKSDMDNGVKTGTVKVLTTDDLLKMVDTLIHLGETQEEFKTFISLRTITDRNKKAGFVAQALTLIMNVRGENNPVKLAKLYQTMRVDSSMETIAKLLHTGEDEIRSYEALLKAETDQVKDLIKKHDKPVLNDLKLQFNDSDYETVIRAFKHAGKGDNSKSALRIAQFYLERNEAKIIPTSGEFVNPVVITEVKK